MSLIPPEAFFLHLNSESILLRRRCRCCVFSFPRRDSVILPDICRSRIHCEAVPLRPRARPYVRPSVSKSAGGYEYKREKDEEDSTRSFSSRVRILHGPFRSRQSTMNRGGELPIRLGLKINVFPFWGFDNTNDSSSNKFLQTCVALLKLWQ